MKESMLKTFASKYRTSASKIWKKYSMDGKFRVKYRTKKGEKFAYLIDNVFVKIERLRKKTQKSTNCQIQYSLQLVQAL